MLYVSILISALIVFKKPYELFFDGKKKEAIDVVVYTAVSLLVVVVIIFTSMLLLNTTPTKNNYTVTIFVLVGVFVVVLVGFFVMKSKDSIDNSTSTNTNIATEQRSISLSEIAVHNSKDSCWTTINGEVFDVTSFISKHKGGDKILNACGIDATDFFTGKHPTIGRVHSEMAVKILSNMKIGLLQNSY